MIKGYIFAIVVIFSLIVVSACNEKGVTEDGVFSEYGYLLIRNWDRAIKISFDTLGNGKAIKGNTSQYYDDPFEKFDTILVVDNFQIEKEFDRVKFNRIIRELNKGQMLENGFIFGAPHVELFIGGEKLANIYFHFTGPIDDLLRLIYPYVSFNIYKLSE